jgi:hypothetical protein
MIGEPGKLCSWPWFKTCASVNWFLSFLTTLVHVQRLQIGNDYEDDWAVGEEFEAGGLRRFQGVPRCLP